jgi:hypothetical protein
MIPNFGIIALAALVPLVIGFIYYNPKVVGTAWMKASGVTKEKMEGANMGVIFGVSLLVSFMISFVMFHLVVHQSALHSLFFNEPGFQVEGSDTMNELGALMDLYGDRFRTFKHGSFHGTIVGIFIIFPIILTNALFERKSFKYALINSGYWIITLALMGGVICQWA